MDSGTVDVETDSAKYCLGLHCVEMLQISDLAEQVD